jgi:hypothetical protein
MKDFNESIARRLNLILDIINDHEGQNLELKSAIEEWLENYYGLKEIIKKYERTNPRKNIKAS